ncbi:lipoyl(octanoyl) transferase LipB [Myxococcota bacterium]|nr:lipoyl(octanoyl) transferase LipB [Myxococcota bacterium]
MISEPGRGGLRVEWMGVVPYDDALRLQREGVEARLSGETPDRLLLLEHPPVITCGRGTQRENLLSSRDELESLGIEVHEVGRGGDVTYHAAGQLVGYLIVDLAARGECDVHVFLRRIEQGLGVALAELGVSTRAIPGMTGVFVDSSDREGPRRKIASIGIGVRRWVTWHGFALNVDIDLSGFEHIVACGLSGVEMTSVARELGDRAPDALASMARAAVGASMQDCFAQGEAGSLQLREAD